MNTILALRYAFFAFFIALNALVGSLSAWNLGLAMIVNGQRTVQSVQFFLVGLGIIGVIFSFAILGLEMIKQESPASRVLFELGWVATFASGHLAGAIILSVSRNICSVDTTEQACNAIGILRAVTWVAAATYLVYLITLFTYAIVRSNRSLSIWSASVRDFAWFPTGGSNAQFYDSNSSSPNKLGRANTFDSDTTFTEKEKPKGDLEAFIVPKGYGYYHPNAQVGVDAINKAPAHVVPTYVSFPPTFQPSRTSRAGSVTSSQRPPSSEPYHTPGYLSYHLPHAPQPAAIRHPYSGVTDKTTSSHGYSGLLTGYNQSASMSSDGAPSPAVIRKASRVTHASARPRAGSVPMLTTFAEESTNPRQQPADRTGGAYTHRPRGQSESFSSDSTYSSRRPNKHRPPPLNLSALSNINNAGRR